MFTEIVVFDLPGSGPDTLRRLRASPDLWRPAPGLLHVSFLHDEKARTAGVACIWRDRAAAAAGHDEAWHTRVAAAFGPPRVSGVCAPDYGDRDAPWPMGARAA